MDNCTYDNIFDSSLTWEQRCDDLKLVCGEKQDFVNFFDLFICRLNGNLFMMVPLAILALFFIFRFICTLVDEYIGASITYIQKWLGLSEALAGVTLLALANGAGDVVTALVASGSSDGVAYNVGALFGAGLFVCTATMSVTILKSPVIPIVVDPNTINRDMVFYMLSTLLVIAFALY